MLGAVPSVPDDCAVLLLPNHSTWWDGFFPYLANEQLFQRPFFIMMLEHRLREFWFFRKLGAFSINQDSPKAIAESLDFTASLLGNHADMQGSKRAMRVQTKPPIVVFFAQGEIRAWHARPLGYTRGVEWLMKKCREPLVILPLAMRCEFLGEEKPAVFLLFGAPQRVEPLNRAAVPSAATLEEQQESLLAELECLIVRGERGIPLC